MIITELGIDYRKF